MGRILALAARRLGEPRVRWTVARGLGRSARLGRDAGRRGLYRHDATRARDARGGGAAARVRCLGAHASAATCRADLPGFRGACSRIAAVAARGTTLGGPTAAGGPAVGRGVAMLARQV